jgi:ABC-type lipoprotein export system ATPase subunit
MIPAITCRDLSYALPPATGESRIVLDQLNATFPAGRINIISGAVGAGKSTLLNVLAGLSRPTSGEVIVNDQAVSRWAGTHRDRWRRQVGIIFQHYHLLYDFSVLENVMLPLMPLGYRLSECRHRAAEALQQVAILHLAGSPVNALSGGERQKTAVARALVTRPTYLLADEPTAHQDSENAERVMNLLHDCAGRNAVVIVATHETELEPRCNTPVRYRLANGRLEPIGPSFSV